MHLTQQMLPADIERNSDDLQLYGHVSRITPRGRSYSKQ